jgi:RNA polymerase sigma-70 factor (ECF subfamily)
LSDVGCKPHGWAWRLWFADGRQKAFHNEKRYLFSKVCEKNNNFYTFAKKKILMLNRKNISRLSDETVLNRYKDTGNAKYFGELYNRYVPLLYGIGLKYLDDAGNAESVVMQLFETLLPQINQYDIVNFRTWIYSVMKNHCLQILRKETPEIIADFNAETVTRNEILHLFDENGDKEKKEQVKQFIKQLPVEKRIAVIRFLIEEMSYADIANTTEYNLTQVKSYIQTGIQYLKDCIETNKQ